MSDVKSDELKKAKRDARARVLALRDELSPERREELGAAIVERFLALPEVRAARTVMVFWSFGSEVPTEPLIPALHARGTVVALPRIVRGDVHAAAYVPGEPLTETWFGAHEPAGGAQLEPTAIDVVAVPAVAFDRDGRRLGYGGGYYDRFLSRTRPDTARIGLAFALQVVDGELPAGHFDLGVDAIVTEHGIIRRAREPG
jgi:5-formyltetrahydrofolate cyclo-ligase